MPHSFLEDDGKFMYYGLRDGPDMKSYKVGLHEKKNFKVILEFFKNRLGFDSGNLNINFFSSVHFTIQTFAFVLSPELIQNVENENIKIKGARPCFYSYGKDGQFGYITGKNGVHYCYGFAGTGFKFMPLHGKIVYENLMKLKSKEITSDLLSNALKRQINETPEIKKGTEL